jgi:hypothetical protein
MLHILERWTKNPLIGLSLQYSANFNLAEVGWRKDVKFAGGFKSEVQHLKTRKVSRCKHHPDATNNSNPKTA